MPEMTKQNQITILKGQRDYLLKALDHIVNQSNYTYIDDTNRVRIHLSMSEVEQYRAGVERFKKTQDWL